jgi:conjugal transfer pilus assembly protein TraB
MIERLKIVQARIKAFDWSEIKRVDKKTWGFVAASLLVISIYAASKFGETSTPKVMVQRDGEFKQERILGDPYSAVNRGRERQLDKTAKEYVDSQKSLAEQMTKMMEKMTALEAKFTGTPQTPAQPPSGELGQVQPTGTSATGSMSPQGGVGDDSRGPVDLRPMMPTRSRHGGYGGSYEMQAPRGPHVISFPVPGQEKKERTEIALPIGSYVKAKLLTGVEAPEGSPYPVLLQLDFAHILPNKKSLDLRGCFMIAKAQGDLSTERVQMQATKLSCVARNGEMFERDINGFVADAVDNSFAIIGEVNSKQDRVAAMAFLSSVVEGVGKAIQMAQTSEQTSADGTSKRSLTGDQGKYITAGGASNAAGMVAQWYLKQAQNLLPTINVGSGQDVWIVMNESVALPQNYFRVIKMGGINEKNASIINHLLD